MANSNSWLTADELFYLGEFQDIDVIYGIPYREPTEKTQSNLVKKGILDTKGNVNHLTVGYVELLKRYMKAKKYLHINQFIFGIEEDGVCIALMNRMANKGEFDYEILLADVILLVQIALTHPIIEKSAIKHYENSETEKGIELSSTEDVNSRLLIEHFDEEFNLVDELFIGMKKGKYYSLNEELGYEEEIAEVDSMKWLIERIPQVKGCLEKLVSIEGEK